MSSWLDKRSAYWFSCLYLRVSSVSLATRLTQALAASASPSETAAMTQPVAAPTLARGSSRRIQESGAGVGSVTVELLAVTKVISYCDCRQCVPDTSLA